MSKYIGTPVVNISADTVDVTGDITTTDSTPEVTIVNNTHEDTDGGREGKVTFKGQQSGGEETTLAQIQASHDGTSDDEKGDLIFKTNDGSDGNSPTEAVRIDSAGVTKISSSIANAPQFIVGGTTGGGNRGIGLVDDNGVKYNFFVGAQNNVNNAFEITPSTAAGGTTYSNPALVINSDGDVGISKTAPTRDASTTSLAIGDSSQAASLDLYGSVNSWAFFTGGDGDLQMYDLSGGAKRWGVDNNGHVTAPYQSAFSAKRNTTLNNFAPGSVIDLSFVTEFFDQNADFNGTTYTAPVTGRYMLSTHLRLDNVDTAAGYYQMRIITSNRTHIYTIDPNFSSDPNYLSLTMSILTDMDASDTAKIGIIQSGGSTQTDVNDEAFFSGFLAC